MPQPKAELIAVVANAIVWAALVIVPLLTALALR